MHPQHPPFWRDDLMALMPRADAANATWLGNLNVAYAWRNVVGHIRLQSGREVVLKFHTRREDFEREWAAARFLATLPGLLIAPALLGAAEQRMVLAFEYVGGHDLVAVLDGPAAWTAWHTAVEAVAEMHRAAEQQQADWLELWPADRTASRLADYDLAPEALLTPFQSAGGDTAELRAAITAARLAVAEPGRWLGWTHSDLQTRHLFWTEGGVRIVDWEGAGLRHRLYDLACLLNKPTVHARRLSTAAHDGAVVQYAQICGLDAGKVRAELVPVLAYECLIGVAETYPNEPATVRADLESIVTCTRNDRTYGPLARAAAELLEQIPAGELPVFAGLRDASNSSRNG